MSDFPKPTEPSPLKDPPRVGWRTPGGKPLSPTIDRPGYRRTPSPPRMDPPPPAPWKFPIPRTNDPRPNNPSEPAR